MEREKKKYEIKYLAGVCLLLFVLLTGAAGVQVQAASYVSAAKAEVSTVSSRRGWVKIRNYYYFYNSKGRLLSGCIKYKGKYYYSDANGRRHGGWLKRNGNYYFYNKKNGVMFKSRWAKGSKFSYYFGKNGVAYKEKWLDYGGKRYYFDGSCRMVTGWKKIGKYTYYFDPSTGAMAKSKWIGKYYVNENGRVAKKKTSTPTSTATKNGYKYRSSTLKIDIEKKSVHGVSYWVAHVKTSSASQLKSALSYGTYGGTRQTTSSAVSSNGGIIGINGSAFDYSSGKPSPLGMCIKNGVIYGDYYTSYSVMAVKNNGTIYTPEQGLKGKDLLAQGVKDTYNFGPVLIKDGVAQPAWDETAKYYPRTAVGMVKPNDYVLLVTNTGTYSGLNHQDLVSIFQSYGCKYAYNLDGGGSVTMYYNGQVLNKLLGNYERPCADFLYFTN